MFAVRVTPDPEGKHLQRIKDQLVFVQYCCEHKLNHLCPPIKPLAEEQKEMVIKVKDLIICVFGWAQGSPVNFFELTWMKDQPHTFTWGKFFAEMHQISKIFSKENPEVAKRIQNWNQIHHGILAKIQLHEADQADTDNI